MSRLSNSWRLVKESAAVLASDKQLVLFPIVSGIASLLVVVLFAAPMWAAGIFDRLDQGGGRVEGIVALFVFYLVVGIVINYCNAALVGAALLRLQGKSSTVGDGFRIASDHVGPIVGYAAVGATVGVALQALRERGTVGEIVGAIGGTAWGLLTYLVIPVLVVEDVGPIEAIKRSGSLLKRTWGEQVIGNFGIGAAFGLITLAAAVVLVPIVVLAISSGVVALMVLAIAVAVLAALAIAVIGNALKGIYTAALYRYAADGATDGPFDANLIREAFVPKQRRGAFI